MLFTPVPDFTAVSGISIPDYSDQLSAEHPYYIVIYVGMTYDSTTKFDLFSVVQSKTPFFYVPTLDDLATFSESLYGFSTNIVNGEWDGTWGDESEIPCNTSPYFLGYNGLAEGGLKYAVIYTNHDIKTATGVDSNGLPVTDGIWFANSAPTAPKPPFVLPDGTELPALPEGCFEKYPYGMISYVESTDVEAAYALSVAEGTYIFAPGSATGEGSDYVISLLPGYRHYRYVVAPTAASGWEQYAESTTQHSGHDFSREDGTIEIRWCNHDILTATAMNDDGTPEIGPDLYRKSDVNYRIYGGWLNSMGNQARRLGNVSGELKPGEMESVFSGATLEPLTVTPTSEEQTFTPESPCIGFSVVTVEAAPDTGGGDIVEPETYPDSEDVDFGYTGDDNPYTGKYFYGTWETAVNLPENPSSEYPYAVIAKQSGSGSVSLFLCAEEPYYYASNGRVIWGVTKPAKSYYYNTTDNSWNVGSTAITGGNNLNPFYWSNVDILDNKTGAVQYAASEPVPEMKEGVTVGGIDNSATYKISGSELTALGLVTKQITGVTASTPSAMISALQMYAGTH